MSTIQTNDIRVQNARNLASMLTADPCYTFIGKPTPWSNDADPPVPNNSIKEYYDVQNELLTLKRISATDVVMMIPRVPWTSGLIYDMYRHDYNDSNRAFNGANNLKDAIYVVVNSMGSVYACLFNDGNSSSTVEPQSESYLPFYTSDGYQWQLLYTISANRMREYSTTNFIPVYVSEQPRPVGEITTIVVDNSGTGYTTSPAGYTNQVDYYYVPITGNGSNAVARLEIVGGRVVDVTIVRGGQNYTYAELNFIKDNCYGSLDDLDKNINKLDPEGLESFKSTVIIPPIGGWGSDNVHHTYASRVGVFSTLKYDMNDSLPDVEFRQTGILSNPESENRETLSAFKSISVTVQKGTFVVGSLIQQVRPDGIASGEVVGWDEENGVLSYIQVPSLHKDTNGDLIPFISNFIITGETAQGTPTDFTGNINGIDFVGGYSVPEFVKNTGLLTYLTNIRPVTRSPQQSERISFVISF